MIGIIENIRRRLENRRGPGAGRRIGCRAGMDGQCFKPVRLVRCLLSGAANAGERRLWRAVSDDPGINPRPGKLPTQLAKLNLRAAIHHHFNARCLADRCCCIVAHAKLHPHHTGANRNRIRHDRANRVRRAKHIHHVDLVWNVLQARVDFLAQQRLAGSARVHRDHPIALALQILHHEVARPVPVR